MSNDSLSLAKNWSRLSPLLGSNRLYGSSPSRLVGKNTVRNSSYPNDAAAALRWFPSAT